MKKMNMNWIKFYCVCFKKWNILKMIKNLFFFKFIWMMCLRVLKENFIEIFNDEKNLIRNIERL